MPIFFMFLGSCALRPFCRRLLRQSQSWIAFELKAAAATMVTSIPVACTACLILKSFEHVPWHALVTVWAWSFFMLFMGCSLYFSIKQWQQSSMEKERLLHAEAELRCPCHRQVHCSRSAIPLLLQDTGQRRGKPGDLCNRIWTGAQCLLWSEHLGHELERWESV